MLQAEDSIVKKPERRIRKLSRKGMDLYEQKIQGLLSIIDDKWRNIERYLHEPLRKDSGDAHLDEVQRAITACFDEFSHASQSYEDFLLETYTEESLNRKEQFHNDLVLMKKQFDDFCHKLHELRQNQLEENANMSRTSGKTRSSGKSTRSSKVTDILALKYAASEAARVKILYTEKETALKKQQAELEEREQVMLAAVTRKRFEIEAEKELLTQRKEAAAAAAEVSALENISERGSVRNSKLPDVPLADPVTRIHDFINTIEIDKNPDEVKYKSVNIPVSSVNDTFTEFTQFLVKKDLLISRLSKFDDNPEHFLSWKGSFKNIMSELKTNEVEELDLLIKHLGQQSSKQAMTLRSAHGNSPKRAVEVIWQRLEERYGAPELIAEALKRKLASFPNISPKDSKQLYVLADIVSEIECVQEDPKFKTTFAYFDSSSGVSPIVSKLPHFLQEKWINRASHYKETHGAIFPPFTFFASFIRETAKVRNDPSFSQPSYSSPAFQRQPNKEPRFMGNAVSTRKTDIGFHTASEKKSVVQKSENLCPIHKKNHSLNECRAFKSKSAEERRIIVRENDMCYRCCSNQHYARDCKVNIKCSECGSNKHVAAMHVNFPTKPQASHGGEREERKETVEVNTRCTQIGDTDHGKSCAKLVLVNMYCSENPEIVVRCYAMLDEQSNRSLVKPELFSLLGIDGREFEYTINSCTGTVVTSGRKADNCVVESLDGSVKYNLPTLIECHEIPNSKDEICTPENARCFPHLHGIASSLPDIDHEADILLLLGRDALEAHYVHDQIVGPPGSPFAQKLGLGWVVIGELCLRRAHTRLTVNVFRTHVLDNGRPSLFKPCENKIFVYDPVFVRDDNDNKPSLSVEDREFLQILDKEFHKDSSGHWVAPLPFKSPRESLPNNKEQALKRAKLLDISLQKNPLKRQHLVEFMGKVIDNGHAQLATELQPDDECWYLPVFGVYHNKKPNQIRGVFDSSAEYRGVSLNSVLLSGPDLTNSLVGILMRFRKDPIAVMADVEQMFYCFSVKEQHRKYLRFFWYQDNNSSKPLVEYNMCKHVFGNSPSPAIATYGLHKSVENCDSEVKQFVMNDFYVDDGLTSRPSTQKAVHILKKTQSALDASGLHLHKIASNDIEVMKCFPVSSLAKNLNSVDFEKGELPAQRSLGVSWNLNQDVFIYTVEKSDRPTSKRGILSVVNSVFDPLGFLSPVSIVGKLILRDVVSTGRGWDEPIEKNVEERWTRWKDSLNDLKDFKIPRCYFGRPIGDTTKVELHVFSDASLQAIAAVAYLVGFTNQGENLVSCVMGKAKVAPTSGHTVPRLELCAAVLAIELYESVLENIDVHVSDTKFYSDSRVVLGYIHNQTRRFLTYVSNRVQRIRHSSGPNQWNYVASESNPADVGSRGTDPLHLLESSWLSGPSFLSHSPVQTPEFFPLLNPEQDTEVKCQVSVKATTVKTVGGLNSHCFERFSSWEGLVSAVSTLRHVSVSFGRNSTCRGWHMCTQSKDIEFRCRTEQVILQNIQSASFQEEIACLKEQKNVNRGSHILALDPYLDENGILRVGGRISRSHLASCEKHPLILPGKHHVSKLLVRFYHKEVQHQGRHFTEGALRAAGYWIIGGRRLVSSVIFECVRCKKLRGQFCGQKMSDLPVDRVIQTSPFSHVGVDVFGPWSVVSRRTRGGQASAKRWAVLFTCLTIRAVHIEVVDEMSSSAFINALRRFVAVRGKVKLLRSDRGTNFVGAVDAIKVDAVNVEDHVTKDFLRKSESVWLFNAPHSSHMGGSWERMIGIARRILDSMLLDVKHLTHDVLVTLMAEVAAIINARPIVPISTDPEEPQILTPSALLTQKVELDQQSLGDMRNNRSLQGSVEEGPILGRSILVEMET